MYTSYCYKCDRQTYHIHGMCRECKDRIKEEHIIEKLQEFNKLDTDSKLEYIFRKLHEKHIYPATLG